MKRWIAGSFVFVAVVSHVKASEEKSSTPNIGAPHIGHRRTSSRVIDSSVVEALSSVKSGNTKNDNESANPFLMKVDHSHTNPFLTEEEIEVIRRQEAATQQEGDARRRILQYESKNPTATPSSQAPNRLSPSHEPTPEGKKGTTRKVQFGLPKQE